RDDCYQQNANGAFAVIQQASHQRQRQFQIARCQRGAQLENDACARERHQLANKIDTHYAILAKESVELFQFVIDLARVAAGKQYEQIKRIRIELEFPFFRTLLNDFGCFFFPTGSARVEPVKDLDLCTFDQRLVKRTSLIHFGRADQKRNLGTDTAVE